MCLLPAMHSVTNVCVAVLLVNTDKTKYSLGGFNESFDHLHEGKRTFWQKCDISDTFVTWHLHYIFTLKLFLRAEKRKKIITRMQRLIVVQMVSIIPLVQFPSSWDICLIGCKQPSALFDLGARLTSQAWIITQTAFYLLSFSDLNRLWISLSVVMSPSFPTATCPNPPTHTVSFPARLLHCPRTFSSSDCQIRLHVFPTFLLWPEVTWRRFRTLTCFGTRRIFDRTVPVFIVLASCFVFVIPMLAWGHF